MGAYLLSLAGLPFEISPLSALSPADHAALAELQHNSTLPAGKGEPPVVVELTAEPPWPGARGQDHADFAPAEVAAAEGRLRLMHRRFLAEIDPAARRVRLQRLDPALGLPIALRIALCARLPAMGGLPLHAAGVVADGRGLVFFGPSGAGKSTLAATRPSGVVSDELVAVIGPPWRLVSTGFWGALNGRSREEAAPLAALVELAKGPRFALERLAPEPALRRLLGSVLVPPSPPLWSTAIGVLGRLVREVPVYRMHWTLEDPPWPHLAAQLP